MGDASAEEDYVGSAIGWASTKNLPILFVVEDNNLSILTEKKVRRNWNMHELAQAYKVEAYDIGDDPTQIYKHLENVFNRPLLLNIKTVRKFWHSGAGIDGACGTITDDDASGVGIDGTGGGGGGGYDNVGAKGGNGVIIIKYNAMKQK
jgi:transketolase